MIRIAIISINKIMTIIIIVFSGLTYTGEEDPGVISVKNIYNYYKTFGYSTIIMGKILHIKK